MPLHRSAAWMAAGFAVFGICQWGFLVVIARFGGPELAGRFALAVAITTPVMLFSRLQLRQLQASDAVGRHAFSDYLAVRWTTTALALLAVLIIALSGYGEQTAAAILAVGLMRSVEGLSDVLWGLEQRRQRLELMAQSMILRGFVGLAALALTLTLTGDLTTGLLAIAGSWALIWALFDRRVTRAWRQADWPEFTTARREAAWRRRIDLVKSGLPLGAAALLTSLNLNIPRYFIEDFLDVEGLGIFAAMAAFVVVGQMIMSAIGEAACPRLATDFAHGRIADFRRLAGRLFMLGLLVGTIGLASAALFGRGILTWVYGPSFAMNTELFVWIMAVGLAWYVVMPVGYLLTAMQRFKVQPWIWVISVTVNTIACFILVPTYGLLGAAWAWLVALICQGGVGWFLIDPRDTAQRWKAGASR